jgi:hypothetical protein
MPHGQILPRILLLHGLASVTETGRRRGHSKPLNMMTDGRSGPPAPVSTTDAATVARQIVERIFQCPAVPGSLQWRDFAETEVRLAIEAAARTSRAPTAFDLDDPAQRAHFDKL